MSALSVPDRVRRLISEEADFPIEKITDEALLGRDLEFEADGEVCSRYHCTELRWRIEEEFGFRLAPNETPGLGHRVLDVIVLVSSKLGVSV